jgi:hypothetical protein
MPNNPNFQHFDYFETEFTKTGEIANRQQVDDLIHFLRASGNTTDLFTISHGWNNDLNDARQLYVKFFEVFKKQLDRNQSGDLKNRKFTVLGFLWPSKKFAEAAWTQVFHTRYATILCFESGQPWCVNL